jgi:hypothetical protein
VGSAAPRFGRIVLAATIFDARLRITQLISRPGEGPQYMGSFGGLGAGRTAVIGGSREAEASREISRARDNC